MSTKIQWTDKTWNPVAGCTKVSPGCANCYAERMARRLAGRGGYPADDPFRVTFHPERIDQPFRWKTPRRVFVCSMGDLFHQNVPDEQLEQVFSIMEHPAGARHIYQILTKRPVRAKSWIEKRYGEHFLSWLWLGVTAEDQQRADERIPYLLQTPAAVRFVSVEPMLERMQLSRYLNPDRCWNCFHHMEAHQSVNMSGTTGCALCNCRRFEQVEATISWLIIGCESGPKRRPMDLNWARSLVEQCREAGVPVFVKQLPVDGRISHDPAEWPEELRVREYPK